MIPILIIWLIFSPFMLDYAPPFVDGVLKDRKIKAAMRYHGTLDAYEVSPGVWKFKRNGQVCSLFTRNFERSYKCN
jgi:hypothetical protein